MKNLLFIIVLILSISFQSCKEATSNSELIGEIEVISPQQVYDAVHDNDTVQLVDVRTKEEFTDSHLKGAQNICVTDDDFDEKVKTLDKSKPRNYKKVLRFFCSQTQIINITKYR